ncbi:MAG: flagellar filament capping protein FliD [Pseudomonadota bacterium]
MAAITSAGLGSGLDVASLVTQLVAAERAAPDSRIARAQSKAQTTLSALGGFRSALAGFQDAAKALRDGAATKLAATSANTALLTATATTVAVAGSYSVEVVQLAKAHKLASSAYASSSSAVGSGKLSISVGGEAFEVEISALDTSLGAIRDAINNASDNTGVRAALLNTTAGVRLTLSSNATGEDGVIEVSAESLLGLPIIPAGTGLDALSYTSGNQQLDEIDPAQNAKINIDSYAFESSTNVFGDAVAGVSFAATKAEPGTTFNVSIANDSEAAKAAVQNFVTRYNVLNATISTYTRYDAASQSGGPLLGDATVRNLSQQARAVLSSSITGSSLQSLAQVGISSSALDGSYKLDADKFAAALKADPAGVASLFGSTGYGGKIVTLAEGYLEADGRIAGKQQSLNAQLKDISKQQLALNRRIDSVESRYRAQFTALDTLISQLRTTSTYLTQQLANLPGFSSGS